MTQNNNGTPITWTTNSYMSANYIINSNPLIYASNWITYPITFSSLWQDFVRENQRLVPDNQKQYIRGLLVMPTTTLTGTGENIYWTNKI